MKPYATALLVLVFAAGCSQTKPDERPPRAKNLSLSSTGFYLRHKSWSGISPGAGYYHTSLSAVELDLGKGRIRKLIKSASRPDAMLPHDDTDIAKLIADTPWRDLSKRQIARFQELIRAWLATSPPNTYNNPMALGHEDGHLSQLTISWDTNTVTTKINPRGGFSPNDPLRPPKEWQDLLDALYGRM